MDKLIEEKASWHQGLDGKHICRNCRWWATYELAKTRIGGIAGCRLTAQWMSAYTAACKQFEWRRGREPKKES